jgi:hypothetical protein
MDVKEAVKTAKTYVVELFGDEGVTNLGLEEVEFDDTAGVWRITVGFSRPWDRLALQSALAAMGQGSASTARSYKIVRIDDATGRVVSVKAREIKS